MTKYAVVDIGTNSVRLMIAHVEENKIVSKYKTLRTIRVGEGMTSLRNITKGAMNRTLQTMNEYLQISQDCAAFYCFATSAVRDAQNAQDYVDYIATKCDVHIDIISGKDEATLGFTGSVEGYGGMFDIGGGSTEVMTGTLNNVEYKHSFDLGTVRLLQMYPTVDSADSTAYEKAHALAAQTFAGVPLANGFVYTGIGGTATALAAIDLELEPYDANMVQGHEICLERLLALCDMLKRKTKEQRIRIAGLQKGRADVIVLGSIIMYEFMKASRSKSITISDSDNQEGYLIRKLALL